MNKKFIYFDHASTSPLSNNVLEEINKAYFKYWGNVSSTYQFGIECAYELETLRNKIASILNADSEDIIFTSGSSESISIVFNKISEKFEPSFMTISDVEHQSTTITANILKRRGWKINNWKVNEEGIVKIKDIHKNLNNKTSFVSIIWGQSEIGSLQPIQLIGKKCKEFNIPFHVDGTQILSNGIFDWKQINCDVLSLSAHKFGGPKGIGLLLTNKRSRSFLKNDDISITHEYSIRQGTQSVPLISGLVQALKNIKGKILFDEYNVIFSSNRVYKLKEYFISISNNNKYIEYTGSQSNRLPNHISFILFNKRMEPINAYKIVNYMSENNIAISSGSSCSSSSNKPSKVLEKIGLNRNKLFSNIRVSFSEENNNKQIDKFYKSLLECIDIF